MIVEVILGVKREGNVRMDVFVGQWGTRKRGGCFRRDRIDGRSRVRIQLMERIQRRCCVRVTRDKPRTSRKQT